MIFILTSVIIKHYGLYLNVLCLIFIAFLRHKMSKSDDQQERCARMSYAKRGAIFSCLRCKDYKGDKQQLERHIVREHLADNEVPFLCGVCKRRSQYREEMVKHMAVKHQGVEAASILLGNHCRYILQDKDARAWDKAAALVYYRDRSKPRTMPMSPEVELHPSPKEVEELTRTPAPLSPLPLTPTKPRVDMLPTSLIQEVVAQTVKSVSSAIIAAARNQPVPPDQDVRSVTNQLMATNANLSDIAGCLSNEDKGRAQLRDCLTEMTASLNGVKSELSRLNRGISVLTSAVDKLDQSATTQRGQFHTVVQGSIDTNQGLTNALKEQAKAFKSVTNRLTGLIEDDCRGGQVTGLVRKILDLDEQCPERVAPLRPEASTRCEAASAKKMEKMSADRLPVVTPSVPEPSPKSKTTVRGRAGMIRQKRERSPDKGFDQQIRDIRRRQNEQFESRRDLV